jgi:tetratricopeptide (TPR) repeat protein
MHKISLTILALFYTAINSLSFAQDQHSACAPKVTDNEWYSSGKKAPLFSGLDGIDFPVTTKNPESQKYFNQGLMLSYASNHAEAARSFYEAIRLDSTCAMCYWGYALVLGPTYYAGMEKDNISRAYEAAQRALQLSEDLTQKERMLIMALALRYDSVASDNRSWNDEAYAFTMGSIYPIFPDDPDMGTLYAEALMDQHPRDLWNADGSPKAWTPEILKVLEDVLRKNPRHAGANHFYIHAVEASANPERAMTSADLLRDLVPGAGHLVHMPSHIYIRTGRYHDGTLANQKAVQVDNEYNSACHAQGVSPLTYFTHSYQFMAATAAMEGDKITCVMASMKMREQLDKTLLHDPACGSLQHYYSIIYYVMVKFGMWDAIIKEDVPDADLLYPRAILQYAKGMASLAKNDLMSAQKYLKELEILSKDTAALSMRIGEVNTAKELMEIAVRVLRGELRNKEGRASEGISELKQAIAIEDKLVCKEPTDWFFSVRLNLASVLLESKVYQEAEIVLREDLRKYSLNGWALIGLGQALQHQGKIEEAKKVDLEFEEAWKHSTEMIRAPRIL